VAETAGGALLTLGALTPVAATVISSTMITAIRKVHLSQGPWVSNGGYEYNLTLIALVTALAETGPGAPSVDDALLPGFKGKGLAALSLAAAAVGSYLVTEYAVDAAPSEAATGPAAHESVAEVTADPATQGASVS
jgi:putative oxidoreductase